MSDGSFGAGRPGPFFLGKPPLLPSATFPGAAPPPSALPPTNTGQLQRLKVEDALSYLDQVKMQFQNRPQVYSDFLDIMKDFKSQAIDTPGVIQRVSALFRGHPSLIVGFNTFLPMGYKIEVEGEHGERVSISTPSGKSHIITAGGEQMRTLSAEEAALPSSDPTPVPPPPPSQPPLEFNHAIAYVNKIKSRFVHKPHIYKQFLEILHSYQKEQRDLKAGSTALLKTQTETQVYERVAALFAEDTDLLKEFSQFLPDAGTMPLGGQTPLPTTALLPPNFPNPSTTPTLPPPATTPSATDSREPSKRAIPSNGGSGAPPSKKPKSGSPDPQPRPKPRPIQYDVPLSQAAKHASLEEFQFFDKVRKGFRSDQVYENFLRLLVLYNLELISNAELLELAHSFLGKFPELMRWLSDFLGCTERVEPAEEAHISSDLALEIDYASCKRLGVSYRALPASYMQPRASGRTELCNEVLNDTWVSFPSWSSEDTTNVTSKKSIYEEHIYKTEDERFELDIVIELNRGAIQSLEGLSRRLGKGSEAEARTRTAELVERPLVQRAIRRIYGDRGGDIVDGLRRNPAVAVPLVLKRLKAKEEEWREAQKGFNRLWREQNDKYYLKSLDQQSLTFKQNDLKAIKSKVLLNQIEVLYDERHEKAEETGQMVSGPHLSFTYPSRRSIAYDVSDLLIHHVKRQPSIQKEDKGRIKRFLKQTLPDLLGLEREELSEDEDEDAEGEETPDDRRPRRKARGEPGRGEAGGHVPSIAREKDALSNGNRILSERLARLHDYATSLAVQSSRDASKPPSAAALLKALPKQTAEPSEFYANLLGQVKNLLDGQVDNAQFEDSLREMFTTQAYYAFTMDKIIQTMVRQLSVMVGEGSGAKTVALWEKWRAEGGAGGSGFVSARRQEKEDAYQAAAEAQFADQNCFKLFYKEETGEMTVELVDTDAEEAEGNGRESWAAYIAAYVEKEEDEEVAAKLKEYLTERPLLSHRALRASRKRLGDRPLHAEDVYAMEGLEMSWAPGQVKAKFVANTGDIFHRGMSLRKNRASLQLPSSSRRLRTWHDHLSKWISRNAQETAEGVERWMKELRRVEQRSCPLLPPQTFPSLTANVYTALPP